MSIVYAAFDSQQALTAAVKQLLSFGFAQASIHHEGDDDFREPSPSLNRKPGLLSTVGSFFARLNNSSTPWPTALYEATLRRGGTVLAVDADTAVEEQTARELLRNAGSIDVDQFGDRPENPVSAGTPAAADSLDIESSDRLVAVGGLLLHKVGAADTVRPDMVVGESGLTLTVGPHVPSSPVASEADFKSFQSGVYEIREQVEAVTLTKEIRVVEEILVHKSVTVYTETINDMLRGTVVVLEQYSAAPSVGANRTVE